MSVMVVHPQVQHSRKLVRALLQYGILDSFVTSVFGRPWFARLLPVSLAEKFQGRYDPAIPPEKVRTFPLFEMLWLTLSRFPGFLPVNRLLYYNLWAFDLVVSRTMSDSPARIVVGYETAALHVFRQAKRCRKLCVLDAASVHYKSQENPSTAFPRKLRDRINARKEKEIRLADRILVLSTYARDTFIANGVSAEKLTVLPLGIDSTAFAPGVSSRHAADNGITFLFVGNVTYAKGIDLLHQAFQEADIPGKRLLVVGAPGDAAHLLRGQSPGVEVRGYIPHERLAEIYSQADVFVLPSRLDGFGLVVTEAMASGLPVIVSSHVGAKDMVSDGETGWIFESGDSNSLKSALEHAHASCPHLSGMGLKARASVMNYSWGHYQHDVGEYFCKLLDEQVRQDCVI